MTDWRDRSGQVAELYRHVKHVLQLPVLCSEVVVTGLQSTVMRVGVLSVELSVPRYL